MRILTAVFLLGLSINGLATTPAAVLKDENRQEAHVARDASRRPAEILAFSGVGQGDVVLEIAPAGGYYTALLSRMVGNNGRIYAVDPERIFTHFPNGRKGFPDYFVQDPRTNVMYASQHLDAISIPEPLDQVWMVLYYHDTVWTGEDREAMNRRFFQLLKPGGVYLVVDHHGATGAPDSITKDLHRIDADTVMKEIIAAGFRLDATTDVLANPDDPRSDSVFAQDRRGRTDRFVWRFVKP